MIRTVRAIRALLSNRRSRTRASHLELGARGERAALRYLKEYEGYRIVATNFRVPVGRGISGQRITAEIDIVAYDEETLCFIEVKTRTSGHLFVPERAVDLRKQRQIARAARRYRQMMRVEDERHRYDVVTVVPEPGGDRVELLRSYFDDRVFRRGRYFTREF
jgi:putative endonuclease